MTDTATDTVRLAIAGEQHEGWTEAIVSRGIDAMAGSFELSLTRRWSERSADFNLEAGSPVQVRIGDEVLITGWIDRLAPSISSEEFSIIVAGRDRAADLIDCSVVSKPAAWTGARLEEIAAALALPFGVTVTAPASTGAPIRRFAIQQGETVQSAIERLARFRGLLAVSTSGGDIELITPAIDGPTVMRVAQGDNLLIGSAQHDVTERFSDYVAKGQSSGDDQVNGRAAAGPSASATDPGVARHRPLLVIAEDQADTASLQARARWEASSRAGRAQPASVMLQGWRRPDGALHAPNTLIDLDAPGLFMRGPMLVERVTFRKGSAGTTTELGIVPPSAWSQFAVPEEAASSRVGER